MNLDQLSKIIAKETGEPAYRVMKILSSAMKVIRAQIIKAQVIKLQGLLTIFIDAVPERRGYNVAKKEHYIKPRRLALKIVPSSILKKEIDAKKTY